MANISTKRAIYFMKLVMTWSNI